MALNADILGQSIYDALTAFNNKDAAATGDLEAARLSFCKALSNTIIQHFKDNAEIPALGLVAPPGGGLITGEAKIT